MTLEAVDDLSLETILLFSLEGSDLWFEAMYETLHRYATAIREDLKKEESE